MLEKTFYIGTIAVDGSKQDSGTNNWDSDGESRNHKIILKDKADSTDLLLEDRNNEQGSIVVTPVNNSSVTLLHIVYFKGDRFKNPHYQIGFDKPTDFSFMIYR